MMEPESGNRHEAEGVLNSAVGRGPDGQRYLFPSLVAPGNYLRVGIARVGIALEPEPNTSCGEIVAAVKARASALSTRSDCRRIKGPPWRTSTTKP